MQIRKPSDINPSEITAQDAGLDRRGFLKASLSLAAAGAGLALSAEAATRLDGVRKSPFSSSEPPTPFKDITSYNNFYEFGTDKYSPADRAKSLITRPWTVSVEGLVKRPKVYDIDELLRLVPLEERTYRMRCVEGWSMVIPWVGFSLNEIVKRAEPSGDARFIEFTSLHDPRQMPGQRDRVLDWPYVEGLRLDEAMHPLTILAVGLYGQVLPNQNGAPVRLVVPWKYGFKSAKSIVRIRFVERQPASSWMKAGPSEYGFYSNVNPAVPHARWSQAKERRIGELAKRDTLPFNGYADQVAQLYSGMDLKKNF